MDDMDEIVQEFLAESHENLDQLDRDLVELERAPGSRELLASVFRTIHTIKGTSGFLAFGNLEAVTHVGESLLARLRDGELSMTPETTDALLAMLDTVRALLDAIEATGTEQGLSVETVVLRIAAMLDDSQPEPHSPGASPGAGAAASPAVAEEPAPHRGVAEASVRVDVEALDTLMRLVGELVLTRNQIVSQVGRQVDGGGSQEAIRSAQRLNLIVGELQEGVMKTRMQPIDQLWSKMPRVVRDLGVQCGKQVHLSMVGRETELDRTLLEAVKDPLTHLVRNAIDHGLEPAAARVAAGKAREGALSLRAYHEGGQVVVEVCDDGAGIDPATIAATVAKKALRTPAQIAAMSAAELLQLIFLPGFSTAASVTNLSGRGVGMDVVKSNIESIGGAIEVESDVGRGTTCRLRIPLTLAIVPALIVECAGQRYAIAQLNVLELVALDRDAPDGGVEDVSGAPVHRLRGSLLPLVWLADVLGVGSSHRGDDVLIAVLQAEGRRFGLVVDRVLSTEEIVVRPVATRLKLLGAYSGATILGDGRVALILDVQAVARGVLAGEPPGRHGERREQPAPAPREPDRVLVAGIGGGRRVAIPLSSVTRLELIAAAQVEAVGSREAVQYRGAILPLLRLDRHLGAVRATDAASGRDELVVVIYSREGRSVALAVEEIVDIVEGEVTARCDLDDVGLLGSAVVGERITELLDVRAAILAADPQFYAEGSPVAPLCDALDLETVR